MNQIDKKASQGFLNKLVIGLVLLFVITSCIPVKKETSTSLIDLQSTSINLKDSAIRSILNAQNDQDLAKIYSYFQSPDASARYTAALALGSVKNELSADTLAHLLQDINVNVAAAAAYSLGQIGSEKSVPALLGAFRQYDTAGINSSINANILEAVGKVGGLDFLKAMATVETYKPQDTLLLLGQIRGIYRYSMRNITDITGTQTAIKYVTHSEYPQEVRLIAANYLARSKNIDLSSFDSVLREAFTNESDTDTKLALIQAIGKTKTVESKDLILETIKNATDDRMAASAIKVINNFEYSIAKPVILDALKSSSITTASAAINYLNDYSREADANDYRNIAREDLPWQVKVPLLGIANKNYSYAYAITKGNVNGELKSIFNRSLNLTEKAACIRALAEDPKNIIFLLETARNSQLAPINSAVMESSLNALKNKYFSAAFGGGGDDIKKQVISFVYDQLAKGDEAALEIIESAAKDENQKKLIDASKIESIKSSLSSNVYAQHMLMRTLNALKGTNGPVPLMSNYKKLTSNDFALEGIPHIAEFVTDKGNIKIKLFPETAPATVLNFVQLAKNEFFNNKIFHRVVPNFVIQGGCPRGDGYGSMDYSIRSETPQIYYNKPGMVGMASSGPHTESCQFFITNSPTPHLDGKYTIFAEVISGQDVVNKIQIGDKIQRINLSE